MKKYILAGGTIVACAASLIASPAAFAGPQGPIAVPASAFKATGVAIAGNPVFGSAQAPVGCSGYSQVSWLQNNSAIFGYYVYPHGMTMSCDPSLMNYPSFISYISMSCYSAMYFGGQVPDGNGDDVYTARTSVTISATSRPASTTSSAIRLTTT